MYAVGIIILVLLVLAFIYWSVEIKKEHMAQDWYWNTLPGSTQDYGAFYKAVSSMETSTTPDQINVSVSNQGLDKPQMEDKLMASLY